MAPSQRTTTSALPLRLLLAFSDKAFEQRFLRYYEGFYRPYAQASLVLGVLLVAADWLVDHLAYPLVSANAYRLTFSVPLLLAGLLASFSRLGRERWQALMAAIIVCVAFSLYGTLALIDRQHGSGLGSWVGVLNYTFFEFYCFVILGIGFRYALPTGTVVLLGFVYAMNAFLADGVAQASYLSYHVVTVFLLAAMIGWWREYLLRKEFASVVALEQATHTAQTQAAFLADHDALTGLHNLSGFMAILQKEAAHANARQHQLPLLLIETERVRRLRDTLGQYSADELVLAVVDRLQQASRHIAPAPLFARTASFEIAVLLRHVVQAQGTIEAAELFMDALDAPFQIAGQPCYLQAAGGLAVYPLDGASMDATLKAAGVALSTRTASDRHLHMYNAAHDKTLAQRLRMEDALRHALRAGQLALHYQPQVRLADDKVVGVEALLRWTHPALGRVAPVEFIPILEETGMIHEIGEWVLRQACSQAMQWRAAGLPLDDVAVNVSGVQLSDPGFTDKVAQVLATTGLPPQCLVLELTESVLVHDNAAAIAQLRELKDLGLRLALDDFGTGYSSMISITRFPFDIVKLDRSYVQSASRQASAMAIVEAIMTLANRLGMGSVAEGIEDAGQHALMRELNCHAAQGFLLARPCSAADLTALLAQQSNRLPDATGP